MTRLADALQRANRQNPGTTPAPTAAASTATAVATPDPPSAPAAVAAAPIAPLPPAPVAAAPAPVAVPMARIAPPLPIVPVAIAPAPVAPAAIAPAAAPHATPAAPVASVAPASAVVAPKPVAARPAAASAPAAQLAQKGGSSTRVAAVVERSAPATPTSTPLIGVPTSTDQLTLWRTDPEVAGKLVGTDGFLPSAMEQYRKLAAILHHAQVERGVKVIMTSSAMPGEGKSLTSVNLALTLSDSYRKRVLLVDVDLRRPTVQRIFGLPPVGGLTEALTAREDRQVAITRVSDALYVLPAGRPEADPMSGLTSDRMKRLFAQAAQAFDWVIVDSPPVGLLPDASLLATLVDGVLLVIRSGKAPFPLIKRAVDIVTHQRILGVVMNAIDFKNDRNASGYYEYYGAGYYGTPSEK